MGLRKEIILAIVVLLAGCKKTELPKTEADAPKFHMNFDFDGQNVNMEAGNDNYYMYAANFFDSSLNVGVYKAELKKINCPQSCGYALSVLINDIAGGTSDYATRPDSVLKPGNFSFKDNQAANYSYTAQLTPLRAMVPGASYKWIIYDGSNTNIHNTYSLKTVFSAGKIYSVTFDYIDPSGNCNQSLVNYYSTLTGLQANMQVTHMQPLSNMRFAFSAQPTGKPPYRYEWHFGDASSVSTSSNPEHVYAQSAQPYLAYVKITDAKGDTCSSRYQVLAQLPPDNQCESNFTCSLISKQSPALFRSVTVLLTDTKGETYSTEKVEQIGSKFEILSAGPYTSNERGESTRKLNVRFNCVLRRGNSLKTINNALGTIAVSHR